MSIDRIKHYLVGIEPLKSEAKQQAQERLDALIKPPGSLGKLEEIVVTLAGISGKIYFDPTKRCVIIMSADNGVVAEGVTSAPQSVTYSQTLNFTKGITGINAIAKQFNTDIYVVDVGINAEFTHPQVKNRKIKLATANITQGAAMTLSEAEQAILTGIETALDVIEKGYSIIGVGEMGIGNTTTSAAVLCAICGATVEEVTGLGAGLSSDAYQRKIKVIKTAIQRNQPLSQDPIDVLAKVGGLDIAAMVGVFIGGAYRRVPLVIDGFISIVAALVATRLNPVIKNYLFASHASSERGYSYAAKALGVEACLELNMRLGEGSGCPLMFAIIDAACAIMREMGTFKESGLGEEYLNTIKNSRCFS
ncbi:MAG: nicotinate-nucleotide--dimethylbenzimidazole phosphoribosyltransferase [Dehalococcoidia bacterium]|nr:nicotinate-nucleotide--dimethylbenzimidazole phosphoribosyltransferase [Dehalococcoidia bacterium]